MFDLIGDIHGHADKLVGLLEKLGYSNRNGAYFHPSRKALFIGDYIDRGPQIVESVRIVKAMVENQNAIALMGNHEYNALCFHTRGDSQEYLRPHTNHNLRQHQETLAQYKNKQRELDDTLDWFLSLPLFYENESFRAVHACWDKQHMAYLSQELVDNKLDMDMLYKSAKHGTRLNLALDEILKGKEIALPQGHFFTDKDGNRRNKIRIKWWDGFENATYHTLSVDDLPNLAEIPLKANGHFTTPHYPTEEKSLFFGHYWLNGKPKLLKKNICCLDYSVAKGGKLVAYSFDMGERLDEKCYVCF